MVQKNMNDVEILSEVQESIDNAANALDKAGRILDKVENQEIGMFAFIEKVLAVHYYRLMREQHERIEYLKKMAGSDDDGEEDHDPAFN